jgi:probable rRNA maturation factor
MAQVISQDLAYPDAEWSIVLTDDATIQNLNHNWRHKDRPTDVLSFPLQDFKKAPDGDTGCPIMLGDVVISMETAARQSRLGGWSLDEEIQRLLVHGYLHLLGHDHIHGGHQARQMQSAEKRLLLKLVGEMGFDLKAI